MTAWLCASCSACEVWIGFGLLALVDAWVVVVILLPSWDPE